MKRGAVYCEECVEDIPNDEMYWDETRLYCGRCGSELDTTEIDSDVFNTITSGQPDKSFLKTEDEYYDDDIYDEDEEDDRRDDEEMEDDRV